MKKKSRYLAGVILLKFPKPGKLRNGAVSNLNGFLRKRETAMSLIAPWTKIKEVDHSKHLKLLFKPR